LALSISAHQDANRASGSGY